MGNSVVFYKDSVDTFECDIKIDGASSKAKTRLVLEFQNRTLLFNGDIKEGHVSVKIPKLSDIDESTGKATLEVIVDQTFFEAWSENFDLKNKKNVSVNEVVINSSKSSVMVENVSKSVDRKRPPSILRESCSQKNATLVSSAFDEFRMMSENEKREIKRELKRFKPKRVVQEWAENVFEDSSTTYAKYCMMRLQESSKGL